MDANIWAADQAYGQWLRKHDRRVYRGYIRWARIVTDWMSGTGPAFMYWIKDPAQRAQQQQAAMTRMAYQIGTPWSMHMAYLMGAVTEDNTQGRIIMRIGTVISKLADRFPRVHKSKRRHGAVIVGTLWAGLYFTYYSSLILTQIIELFKKPATISKEVTNEQQ
jgi:hypothetical protein